jgi:hypothetical protein
VVTCWVSTGRSVVQASAGGEQALLIPGFMVMVIWLVIFYRVRRRFPDLVRVMMKSAWLVAWLACLRLCEPCDMRWDGVVFGTCFRCLVYSIVRDMCVGVEYVYTCIHYWDQPG